MRFFSYGQDPESDEDSDGNDTPEGGAYKALRARRHLEQAATAAISTSSASPDKENSEKIVKK